MRSAFNKSENPHTIVTYGLPFEFPNTGMKSHTSTYVPNGEIKFFLIALYGIVR